MQVQVRFFATLREALGEQTQLEWPQAGATVADARAALRARGGAFAQVLAPEQAVRAAVNHSLADESLALADGDELAFFPPVTGG